MYTMPGNFSKYSLILDWSETGQQRSESDERKTALTATISSGF